MQCVHLYHGRGDPHSKSSLKHIKVQLRSSCLGQLVLLSTSVPGFQVIERICVGCTAKSPVFVFQVIERLCLRCTAQSPVLSHLDGQQQPTLASRRPHAAFPQTVGARHGRYPLLRCWGAPIHLCFAWKKQ